MKISCVSDTVTVIELSAQEVTKYHISFEESDYNTPSSRSALWSLIDEAEKISGKTLEINASLEIDFMPDVKGGCLVIISQGEDGSFESNLSGEGLYETSDINNLLDFARSLCSVRKELHCELYKNANNYRLIIHNADSAVDALALEFCLAITHNSISIESTRECCDCIIKSSALEVLSGLFSEE